MIKDPYKFDFDANGVLALTEDNIVRINFIIDNDSNYRLSSDIENTKSVARYVADRRKTLPWSKDELLHIITEIDRQNSTHQDSTGVKKDDSTSKNNGGREKTAEYIYNIYNLYARLEAGDPSLVNDIAKALYKEEGGGRYTFSFASKFCTYVSQALYDSDKYCIYDRVVSDVLPYYAWAYLGDDSYFARSKSKISRMFGIDDNNGDYAAYRLLIDKIRKRNEELTGYLISRKDFDHLLWYYFKGDYDQKDKETKRVLHISRTTEALRHIRKDSAILK